MCNPCLSTIELGAGKKVERETNTILENLEKSTMALKLLSGHFDFLDEP
jgi:hypothetical protein